MAGGGGGRGSDGGGGECSCAGDSYDNNGARDDSTLSYADIDNLNARMEKLNAVRMVMSCNDPR